MGLSVAIDPKPPFAAHFVRGTRSKAELRRYVANCALDWVMAQRCLGQKEGAVMLDIDDTLIDGRENVANGFEYMRNMYAQLSMYYPIHIVTARPDDEHENVMQMLLRKGFCIPPDRLHMLPAKHYGGPLSLVEDFKFACYQQIKQRHKYVVLRMGDKLWDVAHMRSLRGDSAQPATLSHVTDKHTYVFMDPEMWPCMSCKLPGEW